MKKLTATLPLLILLVACNSGHKRIIAYTKGDVDINKAANVVTVMGNGTTTHAEQTIDYYSGDKVTLTIKTPSLESKVDFADNGLYVLNVKNDTIVGSYQNYSAPAATQKVFTQEMLKHSVDSLQQLITNQNVNASNKNFFVLPYHAVKISNNIDATVVGPFHQMTSIEKEEGKEPEVYRFYTVREIRDIIAEVQTHIRP
ncbi:MAG: hypothetical protein JWN76_2646 [Chitinophagaceae bacterium]|nr:hypothetical protein [Chitinophagaceae bacterium]